VAFCGKEEFKDFKHITTIRPKPASLRPWQNTLHNILQIFSIQTIVYH